MTDIAAGDRSDVAVRAYPDGLCIGGWYDWGMGIEPMFLTWDEIEALRKKGKRRRPYQVRT